METHIEIHPLSQMTRPEFTDVFSYSPLTLAYLGDSVYEVLIRTLLLRDGNYPPGKLTKKSTSLVKATTQAKMVEWILPILTQEEEGIYRRARNSHLGTKAKNATVIEYRKATGFEALVGYLYLTYQNKRLEELVCVGLKGIGEKRIGGYLG